VLSEAVATDPSDELARGNLKHCRTMLSRLARKKRDA
jgi:hypothetical protein